MKVYLLWHVTNLGEYEDEIETIKSIHLTKEAKKQIPSQNLHLLEGYFIEEREIYGTARCYL